MPHYEMTGNPVSIAFSEQSPPVKMRSFKLYQDTKEIKDVKILDKDNDPNRLLTERQFALFPLQPLEYDTDYRAVFKYRQNGKTERPNGHSARKNPIILTSSSKAAKRWPSNPDKNILSIGKISGA